MNDKERSCGKSEAARIRVDTRWMTVPLLAVLALTVGEANPWTVVLVVAACFELSVTVPKRWLSGGDGQG